MQDSLHGSAKTEALSDSTPVVAQSDAASNSASEGVLEVNDSRCPKPAQSKDIAAQPSTQVCTISESSSTKQATVTLWWLQQYQCFPAHDELHTKQAVSGA